MPCKKKFPSSSESFNHIEKPLIIFITRTQIKTMVKDKSIVGDLINFRGLVYSPVNEDGVVFLFSRVVDDLHMYIEEIKPGFPDCVARRFTGRGWERILIEFEYLSSNFKQHGHDANECDIVVCWEHDWKSCPIEVIELKTEILNMKNWPIQHPKTSVEPGPEGEDPLKHLFEINHIPTSVQSWYTDIEKSLRDWNEEIWTNIGNKYIGFYSPEKSFASIKPQPTCIQVEYFSRGDPLPGTKVASQKLSPRWAKFTIKGQDQIKEALEILKEAHSRLKSAIKSGEPTAYFSGGMKPEAAQENAD